MPNLKKFLFIISCICLIACLIIISTTYAKYRSSAVAGANVAIARWNIKVNNQTIKNNTDISSVITPIFDGTDDISANIIAPTSEGYFDLHIDYAETDVSFDYDIEVKPNESSSVQDLVLTGFSLDSGTTITPLNKNDLIEGTVLKSAEEKTKDIRVYIMWDDENGTMDNAQDTLATVPENATTLLDVKITFTQNPEASNPSNP